MYNRIAETIEELQGTYLHFLAELCNIESNSRDKTGVDAVADRIVDFITENNYFVERKYFEKAGDCLCIDYGNDPEKPFVVLSAHMDTVYQKGDFPDPAVRFDDTFIYGPGVCDCKGGIAVGLLTMTALKACGFGGVNIRLLLQSDEEISSALSQKATVAFLCEKAKNCIAFLNLEGKYPGKLTVERGGIIHGRFTVKGKRAHAKDKHLGRNAINEAAFKIVEIANRESDDGVSYNCGIITGGTASNVVPDACSFDVEARVTGKNGYDKALAFFRELAEKQYIAGTETVLEILSDRIPMEIKDYNLDLLKRIHEISVKYGFGIVEPRRSLGGSDAAYTTDAGIPTADGLGMIGYNLHSVDEKAEISSLKESAKLLAAIIIELS